MGVVLHPRTWFAIFQRSVLKMKTDVNINIQFAHEGTFLFGSNPAPQPQATSDSPTPREETNVDIVRTGSSMVAPGLSLSIDL